MPLRPLLLLFVILIPLTQSAFLSACFGGSNEKRRGEPLEKSCDKRIRSVRAASKASPYASPALSSAAGADMGAESHASSAAAEALMQLQEAPNTLLKTTGMAPEVSIAFPPKWITALEDLKDKDDILLSTLASIQGVIKDLDHHHSIFAPWEPTARGLHRLVKQARLVNKATSPLYSFSNLSVVPCTMFFPEWVGNNFLSLKDFLKNELILVMSGQEFCQHATASIDELLQMLEKKKRALLELPLDSTKKLVDTVQEDLASLQREHARIQGQIKIFDKRREEVGENMRRLMKDFLYVYHRTFWSTEA